MMEYYCTGGVLQYASGHLTPIELLHVHHVREGERVLVLLATMLMGEGGTLLPLRV